MSTCNGFKLKGLNSACTRVSVQSNVQSTWGMSYRRPGAKGSISHEVGITRDELIVLKCQDGGEHAEIELKPLGDAAGTLVAESSRKATRTLRVGSRYRFSLDPGESLIVRSLAIQHPHSAGAGIRL